MAVRLPFLWQQEEQIVNSQEGRGLWCICLKGSRGPSEVRQHEQRHPPLSCNDGREGNTGCGGTQAPPAHQHLHSCSHWESISPLPLASQHRQCGDSSHGQRREKRCDSMDSFGNSLLRKKNNHLPGTLSQLKSKIFQWDQASLRDPPQ